MSSMPTQIEIAIVGAGPHALTLATHLLQKSPQMRNKFLVFDPSSTWMSQWRHQFAALEIPNLRSPSVHHPHPHPNALRRFAQFRSEELFPPYHLPGTQLFEDFCEDVVHRWHLENRVWQARVSRIEPITYRRDRCFRVVLEDGHSVIARRAVLAMGGGIPQVPDWVDKIRSSYPWGRLCHSHQVDLGRLSLRGERILIVGGGLTSGHLAMGAIARGAKVLLMSRRNLQEKLFDADPGWLGPKYLKGFQAESDWQKRWEMIQVARNGGSITPAMMEQLRQARNEGKISFHEQSQVVDAVWQGQAWQLQCSDGKVHECDRIWLATGTKFNVCQTPLLHEIQNSYPTQLVNGLPVIDKYLRWPNCDLFVMGGLAALQLGPVARNLSGARMASHSIAPALMKESESAFA